MWFATCSLIVSFHTLIISGQVTLSSSATRSLEIAENNPNQPYE